MVLLQDFQQAKQNETSSIFTIWYPTGTLGDVQSRAGRKYTIVHMGKRRRAGINCFYLFFSWLKPVKELWIWKIKLAVLLWLGALCDKKKIYWTPVSSRSSLVFVKAQALSVWKTKAPDLSAMTFPPNGPLYVYLYDWLKTGPKSKSQ